MTLRQFEDAIEHAQRMRLDERHDLAIDVHNALAGGKPLTDHLKALKKR